MEEDNVEFVVEAGRRSKAKTALRCTILFVVVLLTICIVLSVLYTLEKAKSRNIDRTNVCLSSSCLREYAVLHKSEKPKSRNVSRTNVCLSSSCLREYADLLRRVNWSVDPCDDFYAYACGGWQRDHPLESGVPMLTAFSELNNDNLDVVRRSLETADKNYNQNAAVMKTLRYYNTCLDTNSIESRGAAPLKKLISDYGGWSVIHPSGISYTTLEERMASVRKELNVKTLLGLNIIADPYDSNNHLVKLSGASLGMIRYSYYTVDTPTHLQIREAYKEYMKTVARLMGGDDYAETKMMDIYKFELKLAKVAAGLGVDFSTLDSIDSMLDALYGYVRGFPELRKQLRSFCSDTGFSCYFIQRFLKRCTGSYFYGSEKILAVPDSYFRDLQTLFTNQRRGNEETLVNYIMWQVVNQYINAAPSVFVAARKKFMDTILVTKEKPRWKTCLGQMAKPFEMPLALLFVDATFKKGSKDVVKEMTRLIRASFINNLNKDNWMDYSTRQKAIDKAQAIKEDIGYPSYIKDPVKLNSKLKALHLSSSYFEDFTAVNKLVSEQSLARYGSKVDKDLWNMGPNNVNAYYSPRQNRMVVLAGILRPPFYNHGLPRYLNYGSLGMVIGHELTHGFDSAGRISDKNGNLDNWWSSESSVNFKTRSKCLEKQYFAYKVFGKYVNGNRTLNENIADNGGIKFAYETYQSWVKANAKEKALPGLGMTVDQLFFLGFSKPWCSHYTKQAALLQLKVDAHTFNKYRIIGPLSNFPKFSEAFNCKRGSRMNPINKCAVW